MKKIILKLLVVSSFTLISGFSIIMNNNNKSQKVSLQNLIVLNSAMAEESTGGIEVDCNSCWLDCFFGCTTKYRCNVLTPCYMIMAKTACSNGEAGKCNYTGAGS